jgi:hypothetical protein
LNPGKVSQDFLPQWEEEFLESEYQVEVFPRLLLWVFAAVSIVHHVRVGNALAVV